MSNTPRSTTCSSGRSGRIVAAGNGAPRLEPFLAGAERADARLHAVGGDQHRIGIEQRRDLRLIGLQLVERRPDVGVLVGRVLQFDDGQRQPVDEQHHVRPAGVLAFGDGELIDGEPVVVLRVVEVDHARLRAGDRAVLAAVLDRDAVDQHAVHGAVTLDQRRRVNLDQLAVGVFQRFGRQVGIESNERLPQATFQHNVAVVRIAPLGRRVRPARSSGPCSTA